MWPVTVAPLLGAAEELLGREVNVLTEGCLPDMFRERVLREAKR